MKNIVIGICGGSGSGKTTLAENVARELGDKAILISMDSFYKFQANTTYEERSKTNYDHPNAFDADLLANCIAKLKGGADVEIPVYDFKIHNRSSEPWTKIKNKPIIIVEGILLFAFPEIVNMLDLKVFVDTPADVRILRRLLRDVNERQRSAESVVEQYLTTVKPMHDTFIEPNKVFSDIIIPEGGFNNPACQLIIDAIRYRLMNGTAEGADCEDEKK